MSENLPSISSSDKDLASLLPQSWQVDDNFMVSVNQVLNMSNQVNGTYANIPIICRGQRCPYRETCELALIGENIDNYAGKRCPVEVAKVIRLFEYYMNSLEVDRMNMVDVGLIKELVDLDMVLERINRKMAADPDITEDVITLLNQRTNEVYGRPEVKKIIELKQTTQNRKDKVLQLLNSTRKDKAELNKARVIDPSIYASELLKKAAEMQRERENTIESDTRG